MFNEPSFEIWLATGVAASEAPLDPDANDPQRLTESEHSALQASLERAWLERSPSSMRGATDRLKAAIHVQCVAEEDAAGLWRPDFCWQLVCQVSDYLDRLVDLEVTEGAPCLAT